MKPISITSAGTAADSSIQPIVNSSADIAVNPMLADVSSERKYLTLEEATDFFAELYFGEHHIPSKVKKWGSGFLVEDFAGMATFDFSGLSRFVVMCHDKCIRGEIKPSSPRSMKVCIWKRQGREGGMSDRHPTIETTIDYVRSK